MSEMLYTRYNLCRLYNPLGYLIRYLLTLLYRYRFKLFAPSVKISCEE